MIYSPNTRTIDAIGVDISSLQGDPTQTIVTKSYVRTCLRLAWDNMALAFRLNSVPPLQRGISFTLPANQRNFGPSYSTAECKLTALDSVVDYQTLFEIDTSGSSIEYKRPESSQPTLGPNNYRQFGDIVFLSPATRDRNFYINAKVSYVFPESGPIGIQNAESYLFQRGLYYARDGDGNNPGNTFQLSQTFLDQLVSSMISEDPVIRTVDSDHVSESDVLLPRLAGGFILT